MFLFMPREQNNAEYQLNNKSTKIKMSRRKIRKFMLDEEEDIGKNSPPEFLRTVTFVTSRAMFRRVTLCCGVRSNIIYIYIHN